MYQVKEEDKDQICELLEQNQEWFQNWFRGEADKDTLTVHGETIHEKWRLVNKQTPNLINTKKDFLKVWPSMHGKYADHDFHQSREVHSIDKLSDEYFLVISTETTKINDKTQSRPISAIYRKNLDTGEFKVFHVHE